MNRPAWRILLHLETKSTHRTVRFAKRYHMGCQAVLSDIRTTRMEAVRGHGENYEEGSLWILLSRLEHMLRDCKAFHRNHCLHLTAAAWFIRLQYD